MSEAQFISGKRGYGKGLYGVLQASRYLKQNRMVATNVDLFLEHLTQPHNTTNVYRLPDQPKSWHYEALPMPTENIKDEDSFGLLLLDEVSIYLNAQKWNEKDRQQQKDFFNESRKKGWDIVFIGQYFNQLDNGLRELVDTHSFVKRTDKLAIPFITFFFKNFFDLDVRWPKFHYALTFNGINKLAVRTGVDFYHHSAVGKGYDTSQSIRANQVTAPYTLLSHYQLKGRYMSNMKLYKSYMFRGAAGSFLICLLSFYAYSFFTIQPMEDELKQLKMAQSGKQPVTEEKEEPSLLSFKSSKDNGPKIVGQSSIGDKTFLHLNDGKMIAATSVKFEEGARKYKVGDRWLEY